MVDKSGEDGWQSFLEVCARAQSSEELNELLDLFLTSQERSAIATRVLIVKELLRGEKPQREIAKDLRVSIAKITRGSNFLKTVSKKLRRILQNFS